MIDQAKYIVIVAKGNETPIIFPCWMNHSDFGSGKKVISAGRVTFNPLYDDGHGMTSIDVVCCGQSIMKDKDGNPIKSRPQEDEMLILQAIVREEEE